MTSVGAAWVPSAEDELLEAALAGDQSAFGSLAERYRRELQVYCYRMLGSLQDAEDLVQETFLRAWRKRASFERRSSFRAWLYRIAANACFDALDARPRRIVPSDVSAPADPNSPVRPPEDLPWLQPYPDLLLDGLAEEGADPVAHVVSRETIEIAFLAAIQHLPAKQRTVLILRDVLRWSALEVASLLDTSVPSVNSALQRARATLKRHLPERRIEWPRSADAAEAERLLLARYVDAWDRADVEALVSLLREDARMTMPPTPSWYLGRDAIAAYLRQHVFGPGSPGQIRLAPTRANGCPAFAAYCRQEGDSSYRPFALMVLRIEAGLVAEISGFVAPELFPAFGLTPVL